MATALTERFVAGSLQGQVFSQALRDGPLVSNQLLLP